MGPRTPGAANAAPGTGSARLWALLCVLAGNMLIDALEVSTAVVALPAVAEHFALPITSAHGLMTAFALGFGGLMLFGLRMVAVLGRRRVYLWALVVFLLASVAGGLTDSPELLMATRFVKGFCAALTAPTGLAIIAGAFPEGAARNRAFSLYTLFGACGFTGGLLVGGAATEISWRLVFLLPAAAVLVLFVFGLRLIPPDDGPTGASPPVPGGRRRLGVGAALACCGALSAFSYGIVSLSYGRERAVVGLLGVAAGFVLLAVLRRRDSRAAEPIVVPAVSGHRPLRRAALSAAALNGSYLGLLLVLTLRLQTVQHLSPLQAALALAPASAPLAVTALFSGRLIARFGTARLIAVGTPAPLAGYLLVLWTDASTGYLAGTLPVLLLVAAGFVLAFGALNAQAMDGLPTAHRGAAGGLYQAAVQTGAVLSLSAVAALLAAFRPRGAASAAAVVAAQRPALAVVALIGAVGVAAALAPRAARPRRLARGTSARRNVPTR
ncbi:MFS transporter [Streptomyces sp. NPDC014870]|uniref:MFS transporter n=1 Tax=Streptomyces sp. NPDC014870 TaxID=3364925 RepID=UPI0037001F86